MRQLMRLRVTPRTLHAERGAVAVEFALLFPLLVAMLIGIMEFGWIFNAQVTVTNAAREATRTMAITNNAADARTAARAASPTLNPPIANADVTFTFRRADGVAVAACMAGATATTTIRYDLAMLTGFFGPEREVSGRAAMRCNG